FHTEKVTHEQLLFAIRKVFNLTPSGIIDMLSLRKPRYKQVAAYGHFGRNDLDLPWERTDKVEELHQALETAAFAGVGQ
uniref:methionine adenosyltransferase domain-containing protein n=1 Tax=Oceanobacillus massiliensis TaxID=1465765 RepID=UPI0030177BE5